MMEYLVGLDEVRVEGRHRQDMGDIDGLAKSIEDVGLINPITVTTDLRLIAGGRRLEAFRRLSREKIPARIVESLEDAAACLRAEGDENTAREPMKVSELVALARELEEIEKPAAARRRHEAAVRAGKIRQGTLDPASISPEMNAGQSLEIAANAVGMSGPTYFRAKKVVDAAADSSEPAVQDVARAALVDMDATGKVQGNYNKVRAAMRAHVGAPDANVGEASEHQPDPDDEWIPQLRDSSQAAALRRRELIREMAPGGYTSAQIGERINMLPGTVRDLARSMGVTINADAAMGRNTRKGIDSNRIVGETVTQLEGLEVALNLVDYGELDPAQIGNWTTSLDASITVLKRMNRKLKEMVQ